MSTLILRPTPQALHSVEFSSALEEALHCAGIECVITAAGGEHRVHISDAYEPRDATLGKDAVAEVLDAIGHAGLRSMISEVTQAPSQGERGLENITSMGIPPGGIFGGVFEQIDTAANDPFSEPPAAPITTSQPTRPRFR